MMILVEKEYIVFVVFFYHYIQIIWKFLKLSAKN